MVRTRTKKTNVPKKDEEQDEQEATTSKTSSKQKRENNKKKTKPTKPTTPPASRPSVASANSRRSVQGMRDIFNAAQHVHQINTSLERLNKMIKESDERAVYEELKRNITFTLLSPERSHYTKSLLNFVSRFLIRESKKALEKEESEESEEEEPIDESFMDELGLEAGASFNPESGRARKKKKKNRNSSGPKITIVDSILIDVLIPFLSNGSQTVRLNATNIIRKVFDEVDDLEDSVFRKLKRALLDRLSDKSALIRASAAKSLHRFQDVQSSSDIVTAAFNFHLKNDPDSDVRSSILLAVEPSRETMEEIINRTRDIKDNVRKAAYHKIAERVQVKSLSIEQRLNLIKEGLNDRSVAVKKVVEKELIMNWFKSCNNDLVKFLMLLDIQSDPKTIDKLLNCLFSSFLASKSDGKTKLHDYVESFCGALLDSRKLLLKQPLTVENGFIWRSLAQFLKENETKIQPVFKVGESEAQNEEEAEIEEMLNNIQIPDPVPEGSSQEEAVAEGSQPSPTKGPTPPKRKKLAVVKQQDVDLLEMVVPQLPHFCQYVKKFAMTIDKKEYDEDQLMDYDFIYGELIKILLLLEVGDEAQKSVLLTTIHDIMFLPNLCYKMTDVVSPLMKVLAKNVFKDQYDLVQFTAKLTTEVHNEVLENPEKEEEQKDVEMETAALTPEAIRELEHRYAKLTVDIEMLKDSFEELIKLGTPESLSEASKIKTEQNKKMAERDDIEKRLNEKISRPIASQSTQQTDTPHDMKSLSDYPDALLKCVQIFAGCLEYGDIKTIDTFIQSHIDNICFPGIMCMTDDRVRSAAIKALGLCCIVSCTLARRYFALFLQIVNHDNFMVQNIALQAMFDFLCEFGIHEMVRPDDSNKKGTTSERTLEGTADIDIPEPELANIEDDDESMPGAHPQNGEDMTYDQFLEQLTQLILNKLYSESEVIRFTAVQGTGKLMLLGKVYSPNLLSHLILLWYNPQSSTAIRHFLGVYFPLFAFQDTKFRSSAAGQSAFEECFVETIGMAFDMSRIEPIDYENHQFEITSSEIENMIVFMANLMTDEAHVRVTLSVCNKIIDLLTARKSDDFVYKYLFKALSCLTIDTATNQQLKEIRILVHKIEKVVSSSSLVNKLPQVSIRRLEKFIQKMEFLQEKLKETGNSSALSLDATLTSANATGDGDGEAGGEEDEEEGKNVEENDDDGEDDDDSTSIINYSMLNRSGIHEADHGSDSEDE